MPFGFGGSKSKSSASSNFEQNIAPQQVGFLEQLWGSAGDLYGNTLNQFSGVQPGVSGDMRNIFQSMQPAWRNQMAGGAYAGLDPNQVVAGINRSINQPSQTGQLYRQIMGGQGNVFLGGMEDMLQRQNREALDTSLAALDARAAASGMSGGSRHGLAQGRTVADAQQGLADRMGQLGYDTFGQDLGLKLGIAEMADANTLARQRMLTDMLENKQSTMTSGLSFGNQMYGMPMAQYAPLMMPWQALSQYGNLVGRPTVLGQGSSSSKGSAAGLSMTIPTG